MTQKLEMNDLSIGDLFATPYCFAIPHYQREYAWEAEHAIRLYDDIHTAMLEHQADPASNPYFLGSMLVCGEAVAGRSVPPARLDIVDGQQRVITLTMLFACLRDMLKGPLADQLAVLVARPDGPALHLRPVDSAYFQDFVLSPRATRKSMPRLTEDASASHQNIRENRNTLRRRLEMETAATRENLVHYVLDQCRVVMMRAFDVDYAHQIFLSINERGKDLTIEDIFQAELLGPLDRQAQARYAPIVGHVGKFKRENLKNVGRGKTFFSHIAAAYGWPSRDIVKSIRVQIKAHGGAAKFTAEVFRPMADAYLEINGLVPHTRVLAPEALAALDHLRLLEMHGDDDWLASVMLLWTLRSDTSELAELLVQLERLAHIQMALGFGGGPRKTRYGAINAALREAKPMADVLDLMTLPLVEERLALRNIASKFHIIDKASCRLFLLRLDQHFSGRPLAHYAALEGFAIGGAQSFTVEHLLPKGATLKADGRDYWSAAFPDPMHRQVCAQYIGNLALVTESTNKLMDQKAFETKKALLLGADTHPLVLTEALRAVGHWDFDALKARHTRVMQAVKEIWSLRGRFPEPPAPRKKRAAQAPAAVAPS